MAMQARSRQELLRLLEPTLGSQAATALMDEIEAMQPERLVTRDDVADLRRDVDGLGRRLDALGDRVGELDHKVGELDTKIGGLDTKVGDIDRKFDLLQASLDGRFGRLEEQVLRIKHEVLAAQRGELIAAVTAQTRSILFALMGTVAAIGAVAIGTG